MSRLQGTSASFNAAIRGESVPKIPAQCPPQPVFEEQKQQQQQLPLEPLFNSTTMQLPHTATGLERSQSLNPVAHQNAAQLSSSRSLPAGNLPCQIMISYRRNETGAVAQGGDNTAAQIGNGLKAAGYSVFLDVAELEVSP